MSSVGRNVGRGCGFAVGLTLVGVVLGVFLGPPLAQALVMRGLLAWWVTPLEVTVSAPSSVRVGDTVELDVRLHHDGDEVVERIIGYLDLAGGLYEGFRPVSGNPPWKGVRTLEHDGFHEVAYALAVGPEPEGQGFGLTLEAVQQGTWEGTVTYCPTIGRKVECRSDEVVITVTPGSDP